MQQCVWLSVSVTAEEMRWQDDILFLNSSFTDTAGGLNTWLFPLLPEPGDVTSAWSSALEWRPQRLSWAGTGAACRGNCAHQREEKRGRSETCGVTLQNAELGAAAREGCCSGNAAQATGWRMEGMHLQQRRGRTCIYRKLSCAPI